MNLKSDKFSVKVTTCKLGKTTLGCEKLFLSYQFNQMTFSSNFRLLPVLLQEENNLRAVPGLLHDFFANQ